MKTKNKIIVMVAGPGAGKGTLSQMLMADGNYVYIGVGALLRAFPKNSDVIKIISSGNFAPDNITCDLVRAEIVGKHDFILDGFPRNLYQAKWLIANYADKYDVCIIYMSVPTDVMIMRINKRLCDGAGRADDADAEIIARRIKNYTDITLPAIEWLRVVPKIRFYEIDASTTPVEIYGKIKSVL